MKKIDGIELPFLPTSELQHVQDLVSYDGPLLSHYEHPEGDDYLYYWCDCDSKHNRWMILRVSEASILRLTSGFVPLDFVIPSGCRDSFVFLQDIGADENIVATRLVERSNIPKDYRPKSGAYLKAMSSERDEKSYSVVVEGGWSVEQLADFPSTFAKAYSVIYGLNVLHLPEFESRPWRGGFSSMHFFNWAAKRIPSEHRPLVSAIQYASPGFMRFNLHGQSAMQVTACIADYKFNNNVVVGAWSDLSKYVRDHGLNDILDQHDAVWAQHNEPLTDKAAKLMSAFSVIDEKSFLKTCPRPFEAAKIAMAFFRFIRDLANFEKRSLVRYMHETDEPNHSA